MQYKFQVIIVHRLIKATARNIQSDFINFVLDFFYHPMFQELLVTLSPFITVNHFQLEIKIMMALRETVPSCMSEPGGTKRVTNPT